MIKKILTIIGILLLALISVLLFNTFRHKPWPITTNHITPLPLPDSAIVHFSWSIQYPTISHSQEIPIDSAAFTAFGQFLQQASPLAHQQVYGATAAVVDYARPIVDARILPGESVQCVQTFINNAIADKRIVVKPAGDIASEPQRWSKRSRNHKGYGLGSAINWSTVRSTAAAYVIDGSRS